MHDLGALCRQAAEAAENRGHSLGHFTSLSSTKSIATCWNCKMEVMVNIKPLPNEIEIGGEAVALNCKFNGLQSMLRLKQ